MIHGLSKFRLVAKVPALAVGGLAQRNGEQNDQLELQP